MRFQNGCNKVAIEDRVVQYWYQIILVISNRTRTARSFDFETTRMISKQIALHSVQLPLYIFILHLRTFALIANCFCASLLRTKFTRHVMDQARVVSSKVNNNRANAHCYTFAWNLTILDVRWPLLFFRWVIFSTDFQRLRKNQKIYQVEFWIFCKTLHRILFIWPLRLAVR